MKKQKPNTSMGRAVLAARKAKQNSPKSVSFEEYDSIKTLIRGGWENSRISKSIGRSKNTIMRVKKSASYYDYKKIISTNKPKKEVDISTEASKVHSNFVIARNEYLRQLKVDDSRFYYMRDIAHKSLDIERKSLQYREEMTDYMKAIFFMMASVLIGYLAGYLILIFS